MHKNYQLVKDEHNLKLNNYLLIFMMTDFFFTYLGIRYLNVIIEANPLMVWLFSLPFGVSFFLRLFYSVIIVILSRFLYFEGYKYYNVFISFALSLNIFITFLHFRWSLIVIKHIF